MAKKRLRIYYGVSNAYIVMGSGIDREIVVIVPSRSGEKDRDFRIRVRAVKRALEVGMQVEEDNRDA